MGNLLLTVNGSNLINALKAGAQSTVNTENTAVHDSAKRQVVKNFAAPSPHVTTAIFSLAFVIKSVNLRYLPRLMVATNERDSFRVSDFEREQQKKRFDAVEASVDKVPCPTSVIKKTSTGPTHEQIVSVRAKSSNLEQLHHVKKLTVNITADCHWRINELNVAFFNQNFACFETQHLDLLLTDSFASGKLLNLSV
jgi:hypothetical protein